MAKLRVLLAEALGTFVLVFFACGVAALNLNYGLVDTVAISLAFGLVIVAMAYSIGRISGCHINPAVSLGAFLAKRMSFKEFLSYVCAQIVGGLLGAIALFGIAKMADFQLFVGANCCNHVVTGEWNVGSVIGSLLVEVVLTFVFVFVILNVTDSKNEGAGKKAGLIIGFTLTLVHLLGIGFTGTSVNPARSLATAFGELIFGSGDGRFEPLKAVWIFILAPLAGAALAALAYKAFFRKEEK